MKKTVLLLGHSGKMGLALQQRCPAEITLVCLASRDFDAARPETLRPFIELHRPWAIINTVGYLGIDPCEQNPQAAYAVNTLFPYALAKMANEYQVTLLHFSTDAVFNGDEEKAEYDELDSASPVNVYGMTKWGGDCLVKNTALKYYIARISILFGPSHKQNQFIEKMLGLVANGQTTIRASQDIICSPCYSLDVADAVYALLLQGPSHGVYHLSNQGRASLYDVMLAVMAHVAPAVKVEPASYRDFPFVGRKNLRTPLVSRRGPVLRPWREALQAYLEARDAERG